MTSESSYFPMDGNASTWHGRQIEKLIGRSYQTIVRQVEDNSHLFPSKNYVIVPHQIVKSVPAGVKKTSYRCIKFEVKTLIMSKEDWMTYLIMFKNPFQEDLVKQIKKGWTFAELEIPHKKVKYSQSSQ